MPMIPFLDRSRLGLPEIELPEFELPSSEQVTNAARDAAYVGVGLAVLGFQQAQVHRRDIAKSVCDRLGRLRDALD